MGSCCGKESSPKPGKNNGHRPAATGNLGQQQQQQKPYNQYPPTEPVQQPKPQIQEQGNCTKTLKFIPKQHND